jgi:glycosyltransferase involved in cell wall biosynthesis
MMRITHMVASVGRRSYGLGTVVTSLALSQLRSGDAVQVWCVDNPEEIAWAANESGFPEQHIIGFPAMGKGSLCLAPKMESAARRQGAAENSILHQHGIWTALSRVANQWRTTAGHPVIVAPHGALDAWALKRSAWKKRLALATYEGRNLRSAASLHALSVQEAESCRSFGLQNPIAVIPNGISESWIEGPGDYAGFRARWHLSAEDRIMLFLGRVTPKKGLPLLIGAMSRQRARLDRWKLVIVGDDEFGHRAEVERLIEQQGLRDHVQFIGPQYGQDKRDAFASADLFVLPSFSEGAPMTILEALGAGVPVLTTKASPWRDLVAHRCGWWVDVNEDALTSALDSVFHVAEGELREMGRRGRRLVAADYSWSHVAHQARRLYDWVTNGGLPPEFVIRE